MFSHSYAFEDYTSSANVSEPSRFLNVSLEFLDTIVGSLEKLSQGHDEILISIMLELFHLLWSVMLQLCNKNQEQGVFPKSLQKQNHPYFQGRGQENNKITTVRFLFFVLSANFWKKVAFNYKSTGMKVRY